MIKVFFYKVDKQDRISYYLINIVEYHYFEITKKHVRALTESEKDDLKVILDSKKYNL